MVQTQINRTVIIVITPLLMYTDPYVHMCVILAYEYPWIKAIPATYLFVWQVYIRESICHTHQSMGANDVLCTKYFLCCENSPKWISLKTRTSHCNMDCENRSFKKGWCMFKSCKPKTIKMAAHVLPVSTFIVLLKIITFMQIHSQMLSWLCFIQINLYSAQNEIFLLLFISFNFQISILFLFKNFHCVVLVLYSY